MAPLGHDAAKLVADMRAAGATFYLHKGALNSETWTYSAPLQKMQDCRAILAMSGQCRPGFHAALVNAIREVEALPA